MKTKYLPHFADWEATEFGEVPIEHKKKFILPLVMQYLTPSVSICTLFIYLYFYWQQHYQISKY